MQKIADSKKKLCVIFLLIGILLAVGFFLFSQTSIVKGEVYRCTENADCINVSANCCGCSSMGGATAINKRFKIEWDSKMSRMSTECRNTVCSDALSNDPSCFAEPKCVFGTCRLP